MRRWTLWTVVAALIWVAGCGGGSSTTTTATVTVIISPTATQMVTQTGTVQYTATVNSTDTTTGVVTNITSTGVTWQVNGTTGGSADTGIISAAGLYTAPSSVNTSFTVTITAVSVQDTSASTSATLDVNSLPEISMTPTSATVGAGQTQTFPLTFSSMTNQPVMWEVNGVTGGAPATGTVVGSVTAQGVSQGVYTAPQVPYAPGGQVTVTAVLNSDTTQTASATVTDTYSQASLNCSYAFLIRGENTHGAFLRAGTFAANAQGGLTGVEDINGGGVTVTSQAFTGSYTVSGDGRGTMIFHDSYGSNFGFTDSTFSLVVVSAGQVQVAETDSFATGSGEADVQSSCSPAATAISGGYVFDFSGTDASAAPLSIVGEFSSAGTGQEDSNDNGTLGLPGASITFSSVIGGANGRSTGTFTQGTATTNFAFYEVSASQLVFIELDSQPVVGGEAFAQVSPGGGFNIGSLGGSLVVTTKGSSSSVPAATVATFTASAGMLQAGTLVRNNSGTGATGTAFTGTYAVVANGRGSISLSTGQTYVFYLIGLDEGVVQETDSTMVGDGPLVSLVPVNSAPSLQSLSGSFVLQWSGSASSGRAPGEQDATGEFVALSGKFQSGTLDSNTANGMNASSGFASNVNASLTPTTPYLLRVSPGTITIALNPNSTSPTNLQFAVFFTSPTSAVILRTDTSDNRALSGLLVKQF